MIKHPFPPLYNNNSKILILGSFPSVKSREQQFFYGHPQNRFWKVMSKILCCNVPYTIDDKKNMLYNNCIALWDVINECEIVGSSDSTISNVIPNDISIITKSADIRCIFLNGKTAEKYFIKYLKNYTDVQFVCLPSTSPANASFSVEQLVEKWSIIKDYI